MDIVFLGRGGYAKTLLEALRRQLAAGAMLEGQRPNILGATDTQGGPYELGIPYLGTDAALTRLDREEVVLVNAVGQIGDCTRRAALFTRLNDKGFAFIDVVHPVAAICDDLILGEGVHIHAGAVIQPGVTIGDNSVVNIGALIDHDCAIGRHVFIAPGASLSGHVTVEDRAHIGPNATILQGLTVGTGSIVGAGAVVVRNVPPGVTVKGVPAK